MEALVIIGCLVLSAFFSGMETAYVSANKVYLGVESRQNSFVSRVLTRLTENPIQFVTAMLVGNSIAFVLCVYHLAGFIAAFMPAALPGFWQFILQTILATAIVLVFADFIPKVFFQVYANRLIKLLAVPAYVFYRFFYWVSYLLMPVTDFVLVRVLGAKNHVRQAYFTKGELGAYVNEQVNLSNDDGADAEIAIFQNALDFGETRCADVMTPVQNVSGIDVKGSVGSLQQLFVSTGYSKIVVYSGTVNNVLGYVHAFSLFKKPETIASVMVPIVRADSSMYIKDLLNVLTRRRRSMAVVVDASGCTAGIVTVEDIVEELFGEIEDEHDV